MCNLQTQNIHIKTPLASIIKAYFKLTKFRLTSTVAFSSGMGYILAEHGKVDWLNLCIFLIGGFCITVSANIINQIIERDSDKLMKRTANRPMPLGLIGLNEAMVTSILFLIAGIVILAVFSTLNALILSLISLILYSFVYTPLKTISPIAVFVGAFPGAFPPMIGWLAVSGEYGWEPGILFAIQFFWQFPHFWAIAWVLDEDYKKAGIKLLPTKEGRNKHTASIIMTYTLCLLPLSFLPYLFGVCGIYSAYIAFACSILFFFQTLYLWKECTVKAALLLMFGSFLYLPIVQIAFVLDKIY
ncbi:heme o synthase [uncultured Cytophaga sp.]|uniref:heme o synthase n=1 Tax=uncultured Cytophaga sp. TaxID=160238 RepID=UPI00260779A6|nr:heme o synthase [uncultured Cytophaga sp.]